MREVISLHLGQAGVQVGTTCWELFCIEHGLDFSGRFVPTVRTEPENANDGQQTSCNMNVQYATSYNELPRRSSFEIGEGQATDGFYSFFEEMSSGNYSPRALLIDLEPAVIDEVRTGQFKMLFGAKQLISGKEDAANNYGRGYYTVGQGIVKSVQNQLRKMVESCDKIQGFMLYHSFGGGTGSGFNALVIEKLTEEYCKRSKLEISVFPSPTMATAVVEPYNAILTTNSTLEYTDCVFLADNEAMYNICQIRLDIDNPTYMNLNRLLAQTVSSMTASLRFKGTLNADFIDFQTNLVPYPKIHFPVMSYAPIVGAKKIQHETLCVTDLTLQCLDPQNRLVKCHNESGRYMACCLLYRGDIAPKDVNAAIFHIKGKKEVSFVPWSPTGFKVGINNRMPGHAAQGDMAPMQKAVCMICNTTALREAWMALNVKYNLMLEKKAFLHWYIGEGMDEEEFHYAQENLLALEQDYTHLGSDP